MRDGAPPNHPFPPSHPAATHDAATHDAAAIARCGDRVMRVLACACQRVVLPRRFNPMAIGFEMLATAANRTYVPVTTTQKRVHGFAARATPPSSSSPAAASPSSADGASSPFLRLYLLSKLEEAATVRIALHARGAPLTHAEAMVDTADHWGARRTLAVTCDGGRGGTCEVELPPLSFTMLWSDGESGVEATLVDA